MAAVEQLRGLIRSGTLRPGQRLPPERTLAEMLGVSRPTLREALSALSLLGVVESHHGSGWVVQSLGLSTMADTIGGILSLTLPSDKDVESVLETRAVVESGFARLAAMRITDAGLAEFGVILDKLHQAKTAPNLLRADMALHDLITRESQSTILQSLLHSFRDLDALARSQTIRVKGVQEQVAHDWDRIYEALRQRDPLAAADAMWAHLWRIEIAYARRVEQPNANNEHDHDYDK